MRIEVPPADELKPGIPAVPETRQAAARGADGRLVPGAGTSEQAARAAAARWSGRKRVRALEQLGLRGVAPDAIRPYLNDADDFARHEIERLAREVGGGKCAAGPASMVQSAALAMAVGNYFYDLGFASADVKLLAAATRQRATARQHLLGAHAACVEEAKARGKGGGNAVLDAIEAAGDAAP